MNAQTAEAQAREFAAAFPTPNVLRAVWCAETGQVTWEQVAGLFTRTLGAALAVSA